MLQLSLHTTDPTSTRTQRFSNPTAPNPPRPPFSPGLTAQVARGWQQQVPAQGWVQVLLGAAGSGAGQLQAACQALLVVPLQSLGVCRDLGAAVGALHEELWPRSAAAIVTPRAGPGWELGPFLACRAALLASYNEWSSGEHRELWVSVGLGHFSLRQQLLFYPGLGKMAGKADPHLGI